MDLIQDFVICNGHGVVMFVCEYGPLYTHSYKTAVTWIASILSGIVR